jgi:hypothetical protein
LVGWGEEAHHHAAAGTGTFALVSWGEGWRWSEAIRQETFDFVALEVLSDVRLPALEFVVDVGGGRSAIVRRRPVAYEIEWPDGSTDSITVEESGS